MDPENSKLLRTTENFLKTFLLPLSPVAVVSSVLRKRKLSKFSLLILLIYDSRGVACEAHLAVLYFADDI